MFTGYCQLFVDRYVHCICGVFCNKCLYRAPQAELNYMPPTTQLLPRWCENWITEEENESYSQDTICTRARTVFFVIAHTKQGAWTKLSDHDTSRQKCCSIKHLQRIVTVSESRKENCKTAGKADETNNDEFIIFEVIFLSICSVSSLEKCRRR